jgi:type IV pilus biogenesis protein CpaD/CtpE
MNQRQLQQEYPAMGTRMWATFAVAAALLGACGPTSQTKGPLHESLGDAVRHNIAAQVVDPEPEVANKGEPEMDGRRGALAIERYQTGTEKDTAAPITTGGGGGQ